MRLNERDIFSKEQEVTATALSTNWKDLGTQPPDFGGGNFSPWLIVGVSEDVAAAGAATVTIQLVESDNADMSSATVVAESAVIGKANLTAGTEAWAIRIPGGTRKRYLGVNYVVATGPLTAGKFNAFIALDRQMVKAYARAY
jgi:hypothetical protein